MILYLLGFISGVVATFLFALFALESVTTKTDEDEEQHERIIAVAPSRRRQRGA